MPTGGFSAEAFVVTLALVGAVILVAGLLSGAAERSGLPQVAIFLALGAALGPAGLGLLDVGLDSPLLRIVATLSLVLVLFTDAITLDPREARQHGGLALLVLGPGTLVVAALVALAAWALLGLPPAAAIVLGAALASTDPVLLRELQRLRELPAPARSALRLESGLNDAVLLPIVLVAMTFLLHDGLEPPAIARLAVDLFVLGPGAGVLVGLLAVAALDLVRRRVGVRRDYESLYSLGVAFAAYAAAEAVHGSGFLAAFAAGLTISALDVELCDCFLEYGETTAELALLFAFVLFGGSLIWSGFTRLDGPSLLFAALALLVRPAVFLAASARTELDWQSRLLAAWFGPRGLSSLLLVLLPVFAGVPGGEQLFAVCSLVVVLSVGLHGGSAMLLARGVGSGRPKARPPGGAPDRGAGVDLAAAPPSDGAGIREPGLGAEAPSTASGGVGAEGVGAERISVEALQRLWRAGAPLLVLDVRTERTYARSAARPRGATRLPPDHVAERAAELGLPRDAWLVALCA